MEKEKKHPDSKKGGSIRSLKVNVVYGKMELTECMINVMKGKIRLK